MGQTEGSGRKRRESRRMSLATIMGRTGGYPASISYMRIPRAHQSTALPCLVNIVHGGCVMRDYTSRRRVA